MKKTIRYIIDIILILSLIFGFKYYLSQSHYCEIWKNYYWMDREAWTLSLEGLKRISDDNLKYYVEHSAYDIFLWLEELTDEQAKIIWEFEWSTLSLNSLKKLTDSNIEYLKNFTWTRVYFNWLSEINDNQARYLSTYRDVFLEWLKDISNDALSILITSPRELSLWLEELTDEQAKILSTRRWALSLNKLKTITDEKLELLLSWHYWDLSLNWLTSLTDKQAEMLWSYKSTLSLNWLKKLSEDQTKYFSWHYNNLSLDWLEYLTTNQIKMLVTNYSRLSIKWVKELTDDQFEYIVYKSESNMWTNIYDFWINKLTDNILLIDKDKLNNLRFLNLTEITDEQFEYFSDRKLFWNYPILDAFTWLTYKQVLELSEIQMLSLNGLKKVSNALLKELVLNQHKNRYLSMNGLELITDEQASILWKSKIANLSLNWIKSLTTEQVKRLSSIRCRNLYLNWITELSDEELSMLMKTLTSERSDDNQYKVATLKDFYLPRYLR